MIDEETIDLIRVGLVVFTVFSKRKHLWHTVESSDAC